MSANDDTDEVTRQLKARLGLNVKAARLERNLTQDALGTITGHGRVYIQRIESGSTNVTLETLASLAHSLSITVADLLQIPPDEAARLHPDNKVGTQIALHPGDLAIILPAGKAFEAGQKVAEYLGEEVPLIDPDTRMVSGIAGIPPPRRTGRDGN